MHLDTYIQTTACINSIRNKTVINSDIFETHHSQFQKQLQLKTHLSSAQNNQVINSKHNSHLQTSTQNTTAIYILQTSTQNTTAIYKHQLKTQQRFFYNPLGILMFLFLPAVNQLISCHVDMVPGRKGPVKGGGEGETLTLLNTVTMVPVWKGPVNRGGSGRL